MPNALAVLAISERGGLLHAPDMYMNKIAVGPGYPDGIVDLDASPADNLNALAKAKGVSIVEDRCIAIAAEPSGIRLSLEHQGTLRSERCVLATGAAPRVSGTEDLGLPRVRPVRGVTIRLGAVAGVGVPTRTIRGVVDGVHCYLVPRSDGSLVIGATSEELGMALVARAGGVHQLLDSPRPITCRSTSRTRTDGAAAAWRRLLFRSCTISRCRSRRA